MLGPEQGHKHQGLEPSTEGGGSIHMSVCVRVQYGYVGYNTQSAAKVKINTFTQAFIR